MIEQVARAAADQLDRAVGKDSRSIIARNTDSVRYDVTVAGFTIAGTPASSVGASFSSIPHTGKLNALMWTATPSSGTQM